MEKLKLYLLGGRGKPPSLDDLIRLATALTGRPPTDAEIADARRTLHLDEPSETPTSTEE